MTKKAYSEVFFGSGNKAAANGKQLFYGCFKVVQPMFDFEQLLF